MSARTPAARQKARRIRILLSHGRASDAQRAWIAEYDAPRGESTVTSDATSTPYVAPPAVTLPDGASLPDLSRLDAPPDGNADDADDMEVTDLHDSIEVDASHVTHPDAPRVTPSAPSQPSGCGRCPKCRGKASAPRCPVSGVIIPRPLASGEAVAIAQTTYAGIGIGIATLYQSLPVPPNAEELRQTADAWQLISEKYDLSLLAEVAPFLILIQVTGGYTIREGKKARARKRERGAAKP